MAEVTVTTDYPTDYNQWLQWKDGNITPEVEVKPSSLAELYYNAAKLRAYGEFLTYFAGTITRDIDADLRADAGVNPPAVPVVEPVHIPKPLEQAVNDKEKLEATAALIAETATKVCDILKRVKL